MSMPMRWRPVACGVAIAAAMCFVIVATTVTRAEPEPVDPPRAQGDTPTNPTPTVPTSADPSPASAERGRAALLGRCFSAPLVARSAYETLWKQWGLKARPDDFDQRVRDRYGLHEPPYPNDGLPMGLRRAHRGGAAPRRGAPPVRPPR